MKIGCIVLMVGFASSAFAWFGPVDYSLNPSAVQKDLARCPESSPQQISCQKLQIIAAHMNELANDLRNDAQQFGLSIIALQEKIAQQKQQLRRDPTQAALKASLIDNEKHVRERLAIVRWLESPKS